MRVSVLCSRDSGGGTGDCLKAFRQGECNSPWGSRRDSSDRSCI